MPKKHTNHTAISHPVQSRSPRVNTQLHWHVMIVNWLSHIFTSFLKVNKCLFYVTITDCGQERTSETLFETFNSLMLELPACLRLNLRKTSSSDWQPYIESRTWGDSSASSLPLRIRPIWKSPNMHIFDVVLNVHRR